MSLPNFVNFEPFNILRRKMRAEHMGSFEFHVPERETKADQGVVKPKRRNKSRRLRAESG